MTINLKEPTLSDLYQAVVDLRYAQDRAARSARCRHCGVGDTQRVNAARSSLVMVCLSLPQADLDLLVDDIEASDPANVHGNS